MKQDGTRATLAPILTREDGKIDWTRPAQAILDRLRGFTPWPGAWTTLDGKVLKVLDAACEDAAPTRRGGARAATAIAGRGSSSRAATRPRCSSGGSSRRARAPRTPPTS